MRKVTLNLEADIVEFIDRHAQGDINRYINQLLNQHRQATLKADLIQALQKDAENSDYQAELQAWDSVAGDGIDAEGSLSLLIGNNENIHSTGVMTNG
jgi:glycerol-3-phosphate responsive antiterminator